MKAKISKLAAIILIADWYETELESSPFYTKKLTAANDLEKGEKFILTSNITITFDQNENAYYIQDDQDDQDGQDG